jgi:cytochrome c553
VVLRSQKQLRFLQRSNPQLAEKLSSGLSDEQLQRLPESLSPSQRSKPKKQPPHLFRSNREKLFKF